MFLMLYSSSLKLKPWFYHTLFFFLTSDMLLNFSMKVPNAAPETQYVLNQIQQPFYPQGILRVDYLLLIKKKVI